MIKVNDGPGCYACAVCHRLPPFASATSFKEHIKIKHSVIDDGQVVCSYGIGGRCSLASVVKTRFPSTNLYSIHLVECHLSGPKMFLPKSTPTAIPQAVPDTVPCPSGSQNLSSVLNNPRKNMWSSNFFTKAWGSDFIPKDPEPSCIQDKTPRAYFSEFLQRHSRHVDVHQKISTQSVQPPAEGTTSTQSSPSAVEEIPPIFLNPEFHLEDPTTFHAVLPQYLTGIKGSLSPGTGVTIRMIQEELTHHLDVVELELASKISQKYNQFFGAVAYQDALRTEAANAALEIHRLRGMLAIANGCLGQEPLRLVMKARKYKWHALLYDKLKLISTVYQTISTLQILLSSKDFIGALELISTSLEVLKEELSGIHALRSWASHLTQAEDTVENMLRMELRQFVGDCLSECLVDKDPLTPEDLHQYGEALSDFIASNQDQVVAVVFGMLRQGRSSIQAIFKESVQDATKALIEQCYPSSVVKAGPMQAASKLPASRSDAGQEDGFVFRDWLTGLTNTFNSLVVLMKRARVLADSLTVILKMALFNPECRMSSLSDSEAVFRNLAQLEATYNISSGAGFITPSKLSEIVGSLDDALSSMSELAQLRLSKLIGFESQAGHLNRLLSNDFLHLSRSLELFLQQLELVGLKQGFSLRSVLYAQAKRFLERFHDDRMNKLSLILDSERWKPAEVPVEVQMLASSLVNGLGQEKFHLAPVDSSDPSPLAGSLQSLVLSKQTYVVSGSLLVLLKVIFDYCTCVEDVPGLVGEILSKLIEFLKMYNSRCCQLVLGAGALQVAGLKIITSKQLCLAARGLEAVIVLLPLLKEHFRIRVSVKQQPLLSQFDSTLQAFSSHLDEITQKLTSMLDDYVKSEVDNWTVKPPSPSIFIRSLSQKILKFHETLTSVLAAEAVERMFAQIYSSLLRHLAKRLTGLNLAKVAGPQQGVITSEMAFLVESLKKRQGLRMFSRIHEDVVRASQELSSAVFR